MAKSKRRRQQPVSESNRGRYLRIGVVIAGILVGFGFVAAAFISSATAADYGCDSILPGSADQGSAGATIDNQGRTHVAVGTRIAYRSCPPTSGNHFSAPGAGPIRPGTYGPDANVGPGGWVHNLEHGYIVIAYRPSDPDVKAKVAILRDFAKQVAPTPVATGCGLPNKVVVVPFNDMATPIAMLAWDRYLPLPVWDRTAAQRFVEQWMEQTAPEPSAC